MVWLFLAVTAMVTFVAVPNLEDIIITGHASKKVHILNRVIQLYAAVTWVMFLFKSATMSENEALQLIRWAESLPTYFKAAVIVVWSLYFVISLLCVIYRKFQQRRLGKHTDNSPTNGGGD